MPPNLKDSSSINARKAVVANHVDNISLLLDKASSETLTDDDREILREAIVSGGGNRIAHAGIVIQVHTANNISISGKTFSEEQSAQIRAQISEIQAEITQDKYSVSLQRYFDAIHGVGEVPSYRTLLSHSSENLTNIYVPLKLSDSRNPSERMSLSEAFRPKLSASDSFPIILTGCSGSGKSTLLRHICKQCVEDPEALSLDVNFIPMLVRLPDLAIAKGASLETKLWNALSSASDLALVGSDPPSGFFDQWPKLHNAKWLLLLDGFDEIPDTLEATVLEWLGRLAETPNRPIVILTTRDSERLDSSLRQNPSTLSINPLDKQERTALSANLLGERAAEFQRLLALSADSPLVDLPLTLTISAAVFSSSGEVPSHSTLHFSQFVENSIREAISRHTSDLRPCRLDAETVRVALENIALTTLDQGYSSLSQASLRDQVGNALVHVGRDPESQESLLALLDGPLGLARLRRNRIDWFHESIRTFLAASAIVRSAGPNSRSAKSLLRKWDSPSWSGVVRDAISLWSRSPTLSGEISSQSIDVTRLMLSLYLGNRLNFRLAALVARHVKASSVKRALFAGNVIADGAIVKPWLLRDIVTRLIVEDQQIFIDPCAHLFSTSPVAIDVLHRLSHLPQAKRFFTPLTRRARKALYGADANEALTAAWVLEMTGNSSLLHTIVQSEELPPVTCCILSKRFDIQVNSETLTNRVLASFIADSSPTPSSSTIRDEFQSDAPSYKAILRAIIAEAGEDKDRRTEDNALAIDALAKWKCTPQLTGILFSNAMPLEARCHAAKRAAPLLEDSSSTRLLATIQTPSLPHDVSCALIGGLSDSAFVYDLYREQDLPTPLREAAIHTLLALDAIDHLLVIAEDQSVPIRGRVEVARRLLDQGDPVTLDLFCSIVNEAFEESKDTSFLIEQGEAFYRFERYDEAHRAFSKAIGSAQDCAHAFRERGRCRLSQANLKGALKDLKKAISLSQQSPDRNAAFLLSLAHHRLGHVADALETLCLAITAAGTDQDFHYARELRGDILSDAQRYQGAIADYQRYLTFESDPQAISSLAWLYYTVDEPTHALRWFTKLQELEGDSCEAARGMALSLLDLGHVDRPIEALEALSSQHPDDPTILVDFSYALLVLSRWDEAVLQLRVATNLDPANDEAWLLLGIARLCLNDADSSSAINSCIDILSSNIAKNSRDWHSIHTLTLAAAIQNDHDRTGELIRSLCISTCPRWALSSLLVALKHYACVYPTDSLSDAIDATQALLSEPSPSDSFSHGPSRPPQASSRLPTAMYCKLPAIELFEAEASKAQHILHTSPAQPTIVLLELEDGVHVYGHCNFRQKTDDPSPFKFVDTRNNLERQAVLESLVSSHRVGKVLTGSIALKDWAVAVAGAPVEIVSDVGSTPCKANIESWIAIGELRESVDSRRALEAYEVARDFAWEAGDAWSYHRITEYAAHLYEQCSDRSSAMNLYLELIKSFPKSPSGYAGRSRLNRATGNLADAERDQMLAAERANDWPSILSDLPSYTASSPNK